MTDQPDRIDSSDESHVDAETSNAVASTTVTLRDLAEWRGRDLFDRDGTRIGPLEEVYYDVDDDEPCFGTVKEGFMARHLTFVPLAGAVVGPDSIQVAVSADEIKEAPNIGSSGDQLTAEDEATLYHHYRLNYLPSNRESRRRLVRH